MVSSQKRAAREDETPEARVLDLLLSCGLMERMYVHLPHLLPTLLAPLTEVDVRVMIHRRDDHNRLMVDLLKITSKGFQFLLEDRSAQVWQILMYYIKEGMVSLNRGSNLRLS